MKKITNKLFLSALSILAISITSCDNDDATDASTLQVSDGVTGAITLVSPLSASQTVKEAEEDTFEYTITISNPQPVDIHVTVSKISGNATEDEDFEYDHELIIPAYSTSTTGTIHIMNDEEEEGDENFTLKIGNVNTSNASLTSSNVTFVINDCFSDLAGTYSYVTTNCYTPGPPAGNAAGPFTGTVTFTADGGGVYSLSDASFGGWVGLYGPQSNPVNNTANGVKLQDLCGTISFSGVDQYNEVFTMTNLVITGNKMSFHWENDYGEYGDTELTNPNGNWPALSL